MIVTVITFIVVLSIIVFAHEFGHFYCAKKSGVAVEEFGFGFPPRIFGVKKGDTIYSINWIPIGGFVRLKGESGENEKDSDSFGSKSAAKRGIIIGAGVVMNIFLAWVLISIGLVFGLPQIIEDEASLPGFVKVSEEKVYVVNILEETPASEAGIEIGDIISTVDGETITSMDQFAGMTGARGDSPLQISLLREEEYVEVSVSPAILEVTGRPGIGVGLLKTGIVSYPFYLAPLQGLAVTATYTKEIALAFARIIGELVTGQGPSVDISGPVGIAVVTGEVARHGWRHLLQFTALLSINLGIINVLPLPALDGGRLLFLAIERLRGRPVSRRVEAAIHNTGFALLLLLVVLVTYGDVVRFGDRILNAVFGAFTG
ncbi:MAG: RIP metalloprotease RseP [Patescibacteria group bacterium]|nr:RIP metalloprotease RseP [Patescibacteria group bacterium]